MWSSVFCFRTLHKLGWEFIRLIHIWPLRPQVWCFGLVELKQYVAREIPLSLECIPDPKPTVYMFGIEFFCGQILFSRKKYGSEMLNSRQPIRADFILWAIPLLLYNYYSSAVCGSLHGRLVTFGMVYDTPPVHHPHLFSCLRNFWILPALQLRGLPLSLW